MAAVKKYVVTYASILFLFFSSTYTTAAEDQQPPYRLSNAVPRSYGSYVNKLADFQGAVFFTAYTNQRYSIWKSDGTAEGTVNILPGVNTAGFYVYQDHLYFSSSDGFMRTNGQPGNIELVQSVNVLPISITQMQGVLYFLATSSDEIGALFGLYQSDGTDTGTQLIKFWRYSNQMGTFESELAVIGSRLVFNCPFETGRALCRSDGTSEGTGVLKQIGSPDITWARDFTRYQDQLFFVSLSEAEGVELWVTDGSTENTHIVTDLNPGSDSAVPSYLTAMEDALYFVALSKPSGSTQADHYLWKTDGSPGGTIQVSDPENELAKASEIRNLTRAGNLLYFVTDRNMLWRTDGTAEGTFPLVVIGNRSDIAMELTAYQDKLYFANCVSEPPTLWVSDGTVDGTKFLYAVDPRWMWATPQGLFFNGDDGYHGQELWISDGTSENTHLVANIAAALTIRPPKAIIPAGDDLIYMISDGSLEDPDYPNSPNDPNYRLWVSDGTAQGTHLAAVPEVCSEIYFDPQFHAVMEGVLYYPGADCFIWRTDGSASGTWKVPGTYNINFIRTAGATVIGRRLFFFMGYASAWHLYVIEGDPAQARLVKLVLPIEEAASIYSVVSYQGQLYFLTYTAQNSNSNQPRGNWKLWKSDGTEAGTKEVYRVEIPEPLSIYSYEPSSMVLANGYLFFSAYQPGKGYVLFQSDGTAVGTKIVTGQPATGLTTPLVEAGGYLYAVNSLRELADGETGYPYRYQTRLYKTTGDARGLILAIQFPALDAYDSSELVDAVSVGSNLFLSFRNRLWLSNGTAAGTYPIGSQGEEGVYPRFLTQVGPRVFYSASSSQGIELWSSDGRPEGTNIVADLRDGSWEGERSSSPRNLTRFGDSLLFAADDGTHGIQLWGYDTIVYRQFLPAVSR